ncbi:MAG: N-acetylneuraminate synthase family protein [Saprospiraceae bacterium]
MVEIQILEKKINDLNPTYIIAELSANHNHDFELAVKTVEAAAKTGVDAIKLQTYTPDTITLNSDLPLGTREDSIWAKQRLYDLYQKAYTLGVASKIAGRLPTDSGCIFFLRRSILVMI